MRNTITVPATPISDLEKEYNKLKITLYQKFTQFVLIGVVASAFVELIRAIFSVKACYIASPLIMLTFGLFFYRFLTNLQQHQELIITVFIFCFYLTSMYFQLHGDSGHLDNPKDAFHFAYVCALMERLATDRIPSALYRTIFSVSTAMIRPLLMPMNDYSLIAVQMVNLGLSVYLEFDREQHDKNLFGSYFYSKEQLGKFKDLVDQYIPEGIVVISQNLKQSLFVNNAFKTLVQDTTNPFIQAQLDLFQFRESLSNQDQSTYYSVPSSPKGTLLNLLRGRDSSAQETYLFSFRNPETNENKIFETKILNVVWDEAPAIALVFHDITQQQTIIQLKTAAEVHKDRMLATVSHELRTPLNGILGMIQIMHKKIQDQELLEYLKICKSSANLLLGLVNSILDLNQIRANRLRLYYEKVYVYELLKDIMCLFEFQCLKKKILLKLQISPNAPKSITTDRNRLSQIFINLVGNAVKFTSSGSITISAQEYAYDHNMVVFSVQDTGTGIREKDKRKMFQMYGRLEQDDIQVSQQGVGLGLTISNTLSKLLCGDDRVSGIKVDSEYGKGSTFSFLIKGTLHEDSLSTSIHKPEFQDTTYQTMPDSFFEEFYAIEDKIKNHQTSPFRKPSQYQISRPTILSTENISKPKLPTPTIMIVDDNPFNVTVAAHLVTSQGFNAKSALDGQTAIEMILKNDNQAEPIRLILMDCQMPGMDGYETTRRLKELMTKGKIPEIPIVALTANNSREDREACKKVGMCDYLTKPLTEANLIRVLKKNS